MLPKLNHAQLSNQGKLCIVFDHSVGNKALALDTVNYQNESGQNFTITNFKYYIGQVQLNRPDGTYYKSEGYHLVQEDEAESKKIILDNIPQASYTSVSFIVGVDSLHNCSGAQSGALDPTNGMFWAWNTGYIFLKLEGKSPASPNPGHIFEYHIGGYKSPENSIRNISLPFENPLAIDQTKYSLIIRADVSEILKNPNKIDLSKTSTISDTRNAGIIADNYSDMFSLKEIRNEK
ncbi:MAG: hypothetical protein K0S44_2852 [Bacteroidetes bacterium]|jgi:hypothetical protein|nr:hypothetical protein [Bacteroidota bacterium]